MHHPALFEAIMLVCFGLAWPTSIYKSYTSRANHGKSLYFLFIILIGYISGAIFQYQLPNSSPYVMFLFYLNSIMVIMDILLYFRNSYLNTQSCKSSKA